MRVKGTEKITRAVEVEIDSQDVIHQLFVKWRNTLENSDKIQYINLRTKVWYYEEGDYHSDWDVEVRDATEDEIIKYDAFTFLKELAKTE